MKLQGPIFLKITFCVWCITFSGCTGLMKGDLDESALDDNIEFVIHNPEYHEPSIDRFKEATFNCGNKQYRVLYTYRIQEDSMSTSIMPLLTGLTAGLLPLYSTNDVDFTMTIYSDGRLLFTEEVDARAHFVYGWLSLWWYKSNPSKNAMNCNEGEGIKGCLYRAAYERSLFRLHRVLRDKGLLASLCETAEQ